MEKLEKLLMNKLECYSSIIIYGAGSVGRVFAERIIALYPHLPLESFAVTSIKNNDMCIWGKCVYQIDELLDYRKKAVIVIATLEDKQRDIEHTLHQYGFENIVCLQDVLYEYWTKEDVRKELQMNPNLLYVQRKIQKCVDSYSEILKEKYWLLLKKEVRRFTDEVMDNDAIYIPRLVVVLGTKCSLRCRECNNLMPYFKTPKDLEADEIVQSIKKLLANVKGILRVELIGGEPFLTNNLAEVMFFLEQQVKVKQIEITTNGTILPKQELIPLLQAENVVIRISDYGEKICKDRMVEFLTEYNIKYDILHLKNWISPGGVEKRGKSKEELRENYLDCSSGYWCKTLYESKIFACARAASLWALGYMKEQEYLAVEDNVTQEKIKEFWNREYSTACDYCDIANKKKKYVEPAVQIKN